MVKLYHAEATHCSFDGKLYERGADGSFSVPAEAVAALVESHGFASSLEEAKKAAPADERQRQAQAHHAALMGEKARADELAEQLAKAKAELAELKAKKK